MRKIGIIAEYNPFHNGHKYQIDFIRQHLEPQSITVALSGEFTQRGELAITDKYTRAKMATLCGADLVFELPTCFSTSSAMDFARAGVMLLYNAGVDTLVFSVENLNSIDYMQSAQSMLSLEDNQAFRARITELEKSGQSYAAAYATAVCEFSNTPAELFEGSNNLLGIEYAKAILSLGLNMDIITLRRIGSEYNSTETGKYASATAIRSNPEIADISMPPEALQLFNNCDKTSADDISQLLHYALIANDSYDSFLDCNEAISNRIKSKLAEYVSFSQFATLLSSRDMSVSRIRRILIHILLNHRKDQIQSIKDNGYISHLHLLAFSETGKGALGDIKAHSSLPIITSYAKADLNSSMKMDIYASDIRRIMLTSINNQVYPNEYTRKFNK